MHALRGPVKIKVIMHHKLLLMCHNSELKPGISAMDVFIDGLINSNVSQINVFSIRGDLTVRRLCPSNFIVCDMHGQSPGRGADATNAGAV